MSNGVFDIIVNTDGVQPVCLANTCKFTFSDSITPVIDSVSKTTISDSDTLTFSGSHFGTDSSKIDLKVGSQQCQPTTVSDNQIVCNIDGVNLGAQKVTLNVKGKSIDFNLIHPFFINWFFIKGVGNAKTNVSITGASALKSISPNSGSIYGGTVLTIQGNGFDNTSQVSIDSSICKVISFTVNTLKCLTGAHSSATGLSFSIRFYIFVFKLNS